MKTSRRIISIVCTCAILASITSCAQSNNTNSSSAPSTIYTDEDEYQRNDNSIGNSEENNSNSDDTSKESNSSTPSTLKGHDDEEEIVETTLVIAEAEVSTFNHPADTAYNTSMTPNVPNEFVFQAELVYTEDFDTSEPTNITTETLLLDANTTYADICNLSNFVLVPMEGEMTDETDISGRFDYYGIMHTTANSPATYTIGNDTFDVRPTLNFELVGSDDQIITDASSLISTAKDIRVKAISAKSTRSNRPTDEQVGTTPVMVNFVITCPNGEPYTYQVGMDWLTALTTLKEQGVVPKDWKSADFCIGNSNNHVVLKNADYTLVFAKFGDYVESISLIKN
jgi:hypothetical protein